MPTSITCYNTLACVTNCITEPYVKGAHKIAKAFGPSSLFSSQRIHLSMAPSQTRPNQSYFITKRVSSFCYGLLLILPVINLVVNAFAAWLKQYQNQPQSPLPALSSLPKDRAIQQDAFNMNLALMKPALERANPEEKRFLEQLTANYLSHITPKRIDSLASSIREFDPTYESPEQSSPIQEYYYHRGFLWGNHNYGSRFNKQLAYGLDSAFFLTDSKHNSHIFPSFFEVFSLNPCRDASQEQSELDSLSNQIDRYLTSENKSVPLLITKPFLLDLTPTLEDLVNVRNSSDRQAAFQKAYYANLIKYEACLLEGISKFSRKHPRFREHEQLLFKLLRENTTCIVRTQIDEVSGIKMLPYAKYSTKAAQLTSPLINFMIQTGSSIGALNLRKFIPDLFNQIGPLPDYGLNSRSLDLNLYASKDEFLSLNIIQRMKTLFACGAPLSFEALNSYAAVKPHYLVMGKATIELIDGLMKEITLEKWHEIRANPIRNYLCQTALHQIYIHLSNAERFQQEDNYSCFIQEIEIVHAELQKLLQIFKPFNQESFSNIFKAELAKFYRSECFSEFGKAALGRSATNICAGVLACARSINPEMQSVISDESYYEYSLFLRQSYQTFMADPKGKKLDLYHGQFNPNINTGKEITEYKRKDVASEIREIFRRGLASDHFTASIDCTIDDFHSTNVQELLREFEPEIRSGQINFVFFGSGQKFSMLGMDNYYGAPFYIVNNNSSKWDAYNALTTNPSYTTDELSANWFSLSTKYAADSLSNYRKLAFTNTRTVLTKMPHNLLPQHLSSQKMRVNKAGLSMRPAFVDLKIFSSNERRQNELAKKIKRLFYKHVAESKMAAYQRSSFGFVHCNFIDFGSSQDGVRTFRINPGINPEDTEKLVGFFQKLSRHV